MRSLINNMRENKYLRTLRKIQTQIKDKEIYVNQLKSPVYNNGSVLDVREFADNFARVANGMMSPEEFAVRSASNSHLSKPEVLEYLDKLGRYLIVFADYENKATVVIEELDKLRAEERKIKQQLQIR